MSLSKINSALVQAYQGAGLGLPTAWEARDFKPVPGTPWAAVFNVPSASEVSSLGIGGFDEHTGFLQIDVSYPLNRGAGELLAKADQVRAAFVAGKRFTFDGQCVRIRRCDRSTIRQVDGWNRISLSVFYAATTIRPEV